MQKTPKPAASRRHTMSPSSSVKKPLSELIQQFENPGPCQTQAKDDMSLLSPIRPFSDEGTDKENKFSPVFSRSVADIASNFKGTSTVQCREAFFQSLLERRKEEIKCSSSYKKELVGDAVRSLPSPVKVEFLKAWVDDVILHSDSGSSPNIKQAEHFLDELGVNETVVGQEEWKDWSEAVRVARAHGLLRSSPARGSPLCTLRMTSSAHKGQNPFHCQPELDSSIDAYSIHMSPTKAKSAAKNDISFDIDEGSRYAEHMMAQYPDEGDAPNIRSESLESINLSHDIICPVVSFSATSRNSVDSCYTEGGSQMKSDTSRAPRSCASWFGCF